MGEEALFSWVHLSDIHFGHGDKSHGWDQELVLARLAEDLAAAQKLGAPAPDVILVTGDIAFSGAGRSPDEYQRAREWLIEVGRAASFSGAASEIAGRIYLVPGNHDVNRGVDRTPFISSFVESLRKGETPLDAALADDSSRELLAKRMAKYLELSASFAPACLGPSLPGDHRLFWKHTLTARGGLAVRLVGLNTALLARDDTDAGKLRLGKQQITSAVLPRRAENEVVMVLSHHPFKGWIADARDADAYLTGSVQVHLFGHVHDAETEASRNGAGAGLLRITAGAAHGEAMPEAWIPASHGYSFGALIADAAGALSVRVWPRRWADKRKEFRVDNEAVPDGERYATHPIDVRLPRARVVPSSAEHGNVAVFSAGPNQHRTTKSEAGAKDRSWLPKTGPLRLVLSYADEDEAERAELRKHLALLVRRGYFEVWDRSMVGATDIRAAIREKLAEAHVITPLISPAYFASPVFDEDLAIAEARQKAGNVLVYPVLLKPSDVNVVGKDQMWFEGQPCVPTPVRPHEEPKAYQRYKPVTAWDNLDEALTRVVTELKELIERARSGGS